eukprot:m.263197 g.263197  ORF g.263197 m.263197 type:complete len:279 (-) comp19240_c2_seq3:27-863(-)
MNAVLARCRIGAWIAYQYNFPSMTLTAIHFATTALGLKICAMCGVFRPKAVRLVSILPLCLAFCGFVVFTNLSLMFNSIGFYQMCKVMTTPVIVLLQAVVYNQHTTTLVKASLLLICAGVALATQADVTLNAVGTIFAVCGVLTTSFYQIWVKTKQDDLALSPFQLLYYQAPISACLLACVVPFFEPPSSMAPEALTTDALTAVAGSAALAFAFNLSIFMVIGKTSPVTYNVLGHTKLCSILLGSFAFFGESLLPAQGSSSTRASVLPVHSKRITRTI